MSKSTIIPSTKTTTSPGLASKVKVFYIQFSHFHIVLELVSFVTTIFLLKSSCEVITTLSLDFISLAYAL